MHIAIAILISLPTGYLLGIFLHSGWPRRAMQTMLLIDELREHEGAYIQISCDNPEPETRQDQACVTVCDDWTDWQERTFYAETVLDALHAAKLQRDLSATIETVMQGQNKVPVRRLSNCSLDHCPDYDACITRLACLHPKK